jgi:hypothetical protein
MTCDFALCEVGADNCPDGQTKACNAPCPP